MLLYERFSVPYVYNVDVRDTLLQSTTSNTLQQLNLWAREPVAIHLPSNLLQVLPDLRNNCRLVACQFEFLCAYTLTFRSVIYVSHSQMWGAALSALAFMLPPVIFHAPKNP